MEVEQHKALANPTTFDEASMERSKSFVKALQCDLPGKDTTENLLGDDYISELKNLRPQLYSAAEYCEKSYLHSEQKQMVLDNLKDYAVRALVNAVDHLGTVAYKLTDLLEQQTSDVSTTELKVTCLNQKLLTCHTYMEMEGLRQQQLLAIIPRHHKRYVLPNSVNKKVHFSPAAQTDLRQMHVQARPRVHPPGSPGSKTLSWHLGSETKSPLKGNHKTVISGSEVQRTSPRAPPVFQLLDNEDGIRAKSAGIHTQPPSGNTAGASLQPYGATPKEEGFQLAASSISARVHPEKLHKDESLKESKSMTPFRSLDNSRQAIVKAPVRHKSMLSAFFVKQKTPKLRTGKVA
ncbi:Protein ABIL1 [Bienertia sinuspersici]